MPAHIQLAYDHEAAKAEYKSAWAKVKGNKSKSKPWEEDLRQQLMEALHTKYLDNPPSPAKLWLAVQKVSDDLTGQVCGFCNVWDFKPLGLRLVLEGPVSATVGGRGGDGIHHHSRSH